MSYRTKWVSVWQLFLLTNQILGQIIFRRESTVRVLGSTPHIRVTITVRNENQTAFHPKLKVFLKMDHGYQDLEESITPPELVEDQKGRPCSANNTALERCHLVKKLRKDTEVCVAKILLLEHSNCIWPSATNIRRCLTTTRCAWTECWCYEGHQSQSN